MKVKDPCPHCGRPYLAVTRFVPAKNHWDDPIKIRDVDDHDCPVFRTEVPLQTDPEFVVHPSRTDEQLQEAMRRYRRSLR